MAKKASRGPLRLGRLSADGLAVWLAEQRKVVNRTVKGLSVARAAMPDRLWARDLELAQDYLSRAVASMALAESLTMSKVRFARLLPGVVRAEPESSDPFVVEQLRVDAVTRQS